MKKSERIAKFEFVADSLGGVDKISDEKFFYLLDKYDLEPEDIGFQSSKEEIQKKVNNK